MEQFIKSVENLFFQNSPVLSPIKNVPALLFHLRELSRVIGMTEIKKTIISQIKFIIVNKIRRNKSDFKTEKNLFDGHMLHTVFSGPPGCGKTSTAEIVCKIWSSLGILKSNSSKSKPELPKLPDATDFIKRYREQKALNLITSVPELLDSSIKSIEECARYFSKNFSFNRRIKIVTNSIETCSAAIKAYLEEKKRSQSLISSLLLADSISSRDIIFEEPIFLKYGRDDLVAEYVGQTSIKTRKALEKGLGGVVLIDEAYELYNSTDREDTFGMECLTTITKFMSEHADEIVIVFAGYSKLLQKTIFRAQPGLQRRIGWVFEITEYSAEELKDIFLHQLWKSGKWVSHNNEQLTEIFELNKDKFPNFGGDTERLVSIVKSHVCEKYFDEIIKNQDVNLSYVSLDDVKEGIKKLTLTNSKVKEKVEESPPPPWGIYS